MFAVSLMFFSALGAICAEGNSNGTVVVDDTIVISDDETELQGLNSHFEIRKDTANNVIYITIEDLDVIVKDQTGMLIETDNNSLDITLKGTNSVVASPDKNAFRCIGIEIKSDLKSVNIHSEGENHSTLNATSSNVLTDSVKYGRSEGIMITAKQSISITNVDIVAKAGNAIVTSAKIAQGETRWSQSTALDLAVTGDESQVNITGCNMVLESKSASLAVISLESEGIVSPIYDSHVMSTGLSTNGKTIISASEIITTSGDSALTFNTRMITSEYSSNVSAGITTNGNETSITGSKIISNSGIATTHYTGEKPESDPLVTGVLFTVSAGLDLGIIEISRSTIIAEGNVSNSYNTKEKTDTDNAIVTSAGIRFGAFSLKEYQDVISESIIVATLDDNAKGDNAYCMFEISTESMDKGLKILKSDITMGSMMGHAASTFGIESEEYNSFDLSAIKAKRIVDEDGKTVTSTLDTGYVHIVNSYLVHFDAGKHGEGIMEDQLCLNGIDNMPVCGFVPDNGYRFVGWVDENGNLYTESSPLNTVDEDEITLTAMWEKNSSGNSSFGIVAGIVIALAIVGMAITVFVRRH